MARFTYNRTYQRLTSGELHIPATGLNWAIIALQAEQIERECGAEGLRSFWQELERVNGLPAGALADVECAVVPVSD